MAPKLTALAAQRARLVPLVILGIAERSVAYGRVSSESQKEDETINGQKTVLLKDITIRDDPSLPIAQQRKLVGQFWDTASPAPSRSSNALRDASSSP